MEIWNIVTKGILKLEVIKRGVLNISLALLLKKICYNLTKASIESKISSGSFIASIFIHSLAVIGCYNFNLPNYKKNYFKLQTKTITP